ncbi:hypothetical protein [Desulfosediminicola ganghwensis]|uniref:hypothetical protein n=1 Tax=Desulfosediminicola ganghwensis TaxID=2569540 RepID=UPI001E44CBC2|nr:hypothetical protein [Desulfosediminicola ganghwensis]
MPGYLLLRVPEFQMGLDDVDIPLSLTFPARTIEQLRELRPTCMPLHFGNFLSQGLPLEVRTQPIYRGLTRMALV